MKIKKNYQSLIFKAKINKREAGINTMDGGFILKNSLYENVI